MKFKKLVASLLFAFILIQAFGQSVTQKQNDLSEDTDSYKRFSVYVPYLNFTNVGTEKNTHHYEFQFGYQLTRKDRIGIKLATWKLFAPMGIPLWDPLFLKKSEFYPGRLHERGIGVIYQRRIWKKLFATVEVMPLFTSYLDTEKKQVGKGFKLYTSYHVGYHIPLFKGRAFIEPQLHANYWPINNGVPEEFKAKESNWNNFFLFEPNLYIGIKF